MRWETIGLAQLPPKIQLEITSYMTFFGELQPKSVIFCQLEDDFGVEVCISTGGLNRTLSGRGRSWKRDEKESNENHIFYTYIHIHTCIHELIHWITTLLIIPPQKRSGHVMKANVGSSWVGLTG